MADNPQIPTNQYYQATQEVNSYVPTGVSPIPAQPINDIYSLMGVAPGKGKLATRKKSAYELMMDGTDPYSGLIPDVTPLQTNLRVIDNLDHDKGFGSYGYSSILHDGDNEDRYAKNFRAANPDLFGGLDLNLWKDLKKIVYWGGGFLEKTLESAVVKTGQGLAGLYGLTIGNTIDAIGGKSFTDFDSWLSNASDNVFSKAFDGWDNNLKERYHYFQEKEDRDKKGFIASLGDGDFWMNDISDGLGFLVSAAFEVGLVSKLGLGTKLASRLAPLAEGTTGIAEATRGANALTKALNFAGLEGTGAKLVANGVDLTAETLATTAIESMSEAKEARDKVYASFEGKVNPETGYFYTEDEKKRLAAAAAGQVFKQNMTILIGPKFLETLFWNNIGKYAKGIFNKAAGEAETAAGKASSRVVANEGLSNGVTAKRLSFLNKAYNVSKIASLGFLSEGLFEENIQLAISREAELSFGAGDEYYRPGTDAETIDRLKSEDDLFGNVGRRYLQQTRSFFKGAKDDRYIDDELSKSIGIGGLFGVGGGLIHSSVSMRQQAKVDRYWNSILNGATKNLFESDHFYQTEATEVADPKNPGKKIPGTKIVLDRQGNPVVDRNKVGAFLNQMSNIQGIMEIISNTEDRKDEQGRAITDKELNGLAKNVLFAKLAMEYIKAGKKDQLLKNLASTSRLSDKDITALGYTPGLMSEQDKGRLLTKLTSIVEKLDKRNDWIENNVLDNVSEERKGFAGLSYTKTQKQKRQKEFEAKKEYLRGLSMQYALLDAYLDEIAESEAKLGEPQTQVLSSVVDPKTGQITVDTSAPLVPISDSWNSRINALKNHMTVLEKEFGYHWDNMLSRERTSPTAAAYNPFSQTNNNKNLVYSQMKAEEALEKMNELQKEHDQLVGERDSWLKENKNFELRQDPDTGDFFVLPSTPESSDIDRLSDDKVRRINGVKKEEIAIQKKWLDDEWRLTAALKEEKTNQDRKDTYFSRRMTLSKNAYNQYFQREAYDKNATLGQRKMKLWNSDESKRVTTKQYIANEEKLMKATRIEGKVRNILADVNGQQLLAEIDNLLQRDLPAEQFPAELQQIIDSYKGKALTLSDRDKAFIDDLIEQTNDEWLFVNDIFENQPEDDRFNSKYYDIDEDGQFVVKQQYDSIPAIAQVSNELKTKLDDYKKIKNFLNSIPETLPGDWNNPNLVRRRIADVYTETADDYINTYNRLSNGGQSEIAGDSFSTKQDLDKVNEEINELTQLQKIFSERPNILATPEFAGFNEELENKIETLKKLSKIIKERLSSRLKENRNFLVDQVNNLVEGLGLDFNGQVQNQPIHDVVEKIATPEIFSKLKTSLQDLSKLINKEDQTAEDRKTIEDAYWSINGQIAAVHEVLKIKGKDELSSKVTELLTELVTKLDATEVVQRSPIHIQKEVTNNIKDSVLGTLRFLFFTNGLFTEIGSPAAVENFYDDNPASPVYKFREDMNLRKLIRNLENDTLRTADNSTFTSEQILEFAKLAQKIQGLQDLRNAVDSTHNLLEQIEKEKEVVQAKIDNKDNKYENLIVPSIQQLNFIRGIGNFMRRNIIPDGFKNWIFIQAPGGAGKTQTLGTWFNIISGVPRDKVLATAFTEEASRGIKKALLVGEEGPKDASEMAEYINQLVKDKKYDQEVLIIDEFPAIDIDTQRALFQAVQEYSKAKYEAGQGTFKVVTLGDVNQLTFSKDGVVSPISSMNNAPYGFRNWGTDTASKFGNEHIGKLNVLPSLTINFRSNLFPITSFIENFKGSNKDNLNAEIKVSSTDPFLQRPNTKGVVSVSKAEFPNKLVSYLKVSQGSKKTRALIVNESKIAQYKKTLEDAGIKIITDPNDEVTEGIYVGTVRSVQGFSFDEVFIDVEPNDKTLFGGSSVPNFEYNKAMYVAASRARSLIVVTNFSKLENVEDEGIADLESKAIQELQTKDTEFITDRDLEINGAKNILGNDYAKSVKTAAPVKAETKNESALDDEEEKDEEESDDEDVEETKKETEAEKDPTIDEEEETDESQDAPDADQVYPTSGIEDTIHPDLTTDQTIESEKKSIMDKIKDTTVQVYDKVRDSVVKLLFPTSQTLKFKIKDGVFAIKPNQEYENDHTTAGDQIMIVPFRQDKKSKSNRNFGYAVITPAKGYDGVEIPNSYRTLAVLSDKEIDAFKDNPKTKQIFTDIEQNELRDKGFVSLLYGDINSEDGFKTSGGKDIGEPIAVGTVQSANTIKYFFGKDFRKFDHSQMSDIISKFVDSFYANQIEKDPAFRQRAIAFYNNPKNAQVIIPVRKDIVSGKNTKARLDIPQELEGYIQPGKPYLVFRPFEQKSGMQFISLSRRFLNSKEHTEITQPIQEFISLAKVVRKILGQKGLQDEKLGYSKGLSNLLSKLASEYLKDAEKDEYVVKATFKEGDKSVSKEVKFTNIEAQKVVDLYVDYQVPDTNTIVANTEKDLKALANVKKARNLTFEDGTTIYGTVVSYDPVSKTSVIKDVRNKEEVTKAGAISHTAKSYTGRVQKILNDVMNSNGHIAERFVSVKDRTGFVTDRDRESGQKKEFTGYKFMNLLGSKTAPVAKTYDSKGEPQEYFEDVIDILENLFNFATKGELNGANLQTIDNEGNKQNIEVKFRVPVPLNARDENGKLTHDYQNAATNTSRDTGNISNAKYFETNFEGMLPVQVYVEFGEDRQEHGQDVQVSVQAEEKAEEAPKANLTELTEDDIQELSFKEIRERLTPEQIKRVDDWAAKNGFENIDNFFASAESNHPEEQIYFKDYLIQCLL
jgi:hypothetical protein